MEKKHWIFLGLFIVFIITSVIWGYHVDKKMYKEKANGILLKIKIGGDGTTMIELYNSNVHDSTKHLYNNVESFNILDIGDSIVKNSNSYFLNVFTKKMDCTILGIHLR